MKFTIEQVIVYLLMQDRLPYKIMVEESLSISPVETLLSPGFSLPVEGKLLSRKLYYTVHKIFTINLIAKLSKKSHITNIIRESYIKVYSFD